MFLNSSWILTWTMSETEREAAIVDMMEGFQQAVELDITNMVINK